MTFRRNDQCLVRSGSHRFQSTVCAAAGCDVCYERAFVAHMMAASAFEPTDLTRWVRPCCWDSMTVRHSCRSDCSDCIQSPRPAPTCLAQLCQLFCAEQFAFHRLSLRRTFEYSRGIRKKKKNADKHGEIDELEKYLWNFQWKFMISTLTSWCATCDQIFLIIWHGFWALIAANALLIKFSEILKT